MCGHKSGNISAWTVDPTTTLKSMGLMKIHDGAINKILMKTIIGQDSAFVITCSSDNYVKVFKQDDGFLKIFDQNFESPVLDVFQTFDFDGKECFIVSLANDTMQVLNFGEATMMTIPAKQPSLKRFALNISNPFKNEKEGNFLILTEGNSINVNMWVKPPPEKTIQTNTYSSGNNLNNGDGNNDDGGQGQQQRGNYRGGYRGNNYRNNYRGQDRGNRHY